jgi:hypothetical protein
VRELTPENLDCLKVPVDDALLVSWCGPVVTAYGLGVSLGLDSNDLTRCRVAPVDGWTGNDLLLFGRRAEVLSLPIVDLRFDLAIAECRDRIARVWGGSPQLGGLDYHPTTGQRREGRHINVGRALWCVDAPRGRHRSEQVSVPALLTLNPHDAARLEDGSRWVDAAALVLVMRAVPHA